MRSLSNIFIFLTILTGIESKNISIHNVKDVADENDPQNVKYINKYGSFGTKFAKNIINEKADIAMLNANDNRVMELLTLIDSLIRLIYNSNIDRRIIFSKNLTDSNYIKDIVGTILDNFTEFYSDLNYTYRPKKRYVTFSEYFDDNGSHMSKLQLKSA